MADNDQEGRNPGMEDNDNQERDKKNPTMTDPTRANMSTMALGKTVKIDFDAYVDDDDDVDEEETKVHWNMRRTAERPCTCCGQLCGLWIAAIILFAILNFAVSSIGFVLDVPFYDRSDINQEREDAYYATERDADALAAFGQGSALECVHKDPTTLTRQGELIKGPAPTSSCQRATSVAFRLIYISKDRTSNIWTAENLKAIKKVEDYILSNLELSRYCYLLDSTHPPFQTRNIDEWSQTIISTLNDDPQYVACDRIVSPLNFLDPLYFDIHNETGLGYYLLSPDQVPQEYDFSQENLNKVINYWNNFTVRSYDISAFPEVAATVAGALTVQNLFQFVTSTDFGFGSTEMVGLTSIYSLGLPINGYASSSESVEDQYSDIGQWLWDQFDSFLKDTDLGNVEVYWADTQGGMSSAEAGTLAIRSFLFFPLSIVSVLLYLIYMQDSIFIGLVGIMQVMLAFVPSIIIYTYIIGEDYIGVLNLITFYIILGIGVDDIFVFCDQFHHQHGVKKFDVRMQRTFNVASKAMFTTSCTTFISFMANATSVFPAVSTFGIFSALLVFVNFCAIITFFPAVYAVYWTYIRKIWWDHPSLLFCCKREVPDEDALEEDRAQDTEEGQDMETKDVAQDTQEGPVQDNPDGEDQERGADADGPDDGHSHGDGGALVSFFRDTWAPLIVKLRYVIVVIFLGILIGAIIVTTGLVPDENAPSTLPNGNNYKDQPSVLLRYFARSGNPRAIDVLWVSGIDPDQPIDRTGTDDTNVTDYGVANYLDCSTFNPTTPEAQVWSLNTCHDMFFGNVTEFHNGDASFGPDGSNGPKSRKIVSGNVPMTEYYYYQQVSCFYQGFRDWTLTDSGCVALQSIGLPCLNETSVRQGCTTWDVNGNSCEPFPVSTDSWRPLVRAFLQDPTTDPTTLQTNFDAFSEQVFVTESVNVDPNDIVQGDFSCRTVEDDSDMAGNVLNAIANVATLDQDFAQNFEDGLALYDRWDAWSVQMRKFAPREMIGTMQTSNGAWSFYFLNQSLLQETFQGIGLALGLGFIVLTLIGGNIVMAAVSIFNILLIVVDIFAFTVLADWSLGVIEAVNYVVVIGMSIDYSVHMSEAYTEAEAPTRRERVILMVEEMGVSVLSGALSTMLAAFWMFFAPNLFFVKFASFLFATVLLSCIYALVLFPALLAIVGPLGNTGGIYIWLRRIRDSIVHEFTKDYIQSKEFIERELAQRRKNKEEENHEEEEITPKDEEKNGGAVA